ncbi:MAG TPA: LAGLIDADG family homing endonuclease [Anaerolineae bacterium]|nr:LAGLIDADG family homing endonuclease [Anaerolineae bacterium]
METCCDIEPGDYVCVMRGIEQFGDAKLSQDEATLLGYLTADGCVSQPNRILFSNSDSEVIAEYKLVAESVLGAQKINSHRKKGKGSVDHHINSREARKLLETRYGVGYVTAAGKEVPVVVRRAGRDAQIEFIRAYMELECHIGKERRRITVSSASERLLRQVHLMLLNLGIVSKLSHKRVRSYPDRNYWRLCIDGKDAARYVELIGFKTQARREQCAAWDTACSNTNNDSIPNISALLRSLYDGLDTDRKANGLVGDYMNGRANPSYDKLREIVDKLGEADHPIKDYLE